MPEIAEEDDQYNIVCDEFEDSLTQHMNKYTLVTKLKKTIQSEL